MSKVRVVIIYTNELNSILVDGIEMIDIASIQNKPIPDWFSASNGRDGWEGLIAEIQKIIDDREAELNFEFQGPEENKYIFNKCIAKLGFGSNSLSTSDITQKNIEEARRAEHRGFWKKALEYYLNAADYGESVEAQYCVGEYYYKCYKGIITEINIEKKDALFNALKYYEKAANGGNNEAKYKLYELFSSGDGLKTDWNKAIKWLTELAKDGDIQAKVELANYYIDSNSNNYANKVQAFNLYKEAAKQGNVEAQYMLGLCYYTGRGVEQTYEHAVEWFTKAAEQGHIQAQSCLGVCYYTGIGVEKNDELAVEWSRKAAEQGHIDAQHILGECYHYGRGVKQNDELAVEWFTKAAEQGHIQAQSYLGLCYYTELGVEKNDALAVEWSRKAAEQGHIQAQSYLGLCYYYGNGIEKSYTQAVKWFTKAADQGLAEAQYMLGLCYHYGNGVEKNHEHAVKWYRKAIAQGHVVAKYMLGLCFYYGNGVEENHEHAVKWYRKAAEQGYAVAQYKLGMCYEYGKGVDKDIKIAFEWYRKAADNDFPSEEACFRIAEEYYTQKDPNALMRTGILTAASILIPVTNFITIPASIVGSTLSASSKIKKFLKTDAGKEMLNYYRKAAELGHSEAKKKVNELEVYL